MAPRKPRPTDRLLIAWAGEIPRIKAFLDAHRATYDLTTRGHGAHWRVTIHTRRNGFTTGEVTARPGDTLRFVGQLLTVEKRQPRPKMPPPEPPANLYDALSEIETGN